MWIPTSEGGQRGKPTETGRVGAEGKPHAGEESVPHRHSKDGEWLLEAHGRVPPAHGSHFVGHWLGR